MDAPTPTMHDFVDPFVKVEARWRVNIYLDIPWYLSPLFECQVEEPN